MIILNNRKIGNIGENKAIKYLLEKDYLILKHNYYTMHGEIDIIAEKNDLLIFIEVKSRNSNKFGFPLESVDENKINKISKTALNYIYENNIKDLQVRFDVIEVYLDQNRINHIENAFYLV